MGFFLQERHVGWADCGTDSRGRPIGYAFPAWCDEEGCTAKIDRGLSYACGGMHGGDEISCENYFCEKHRLNFVVDGSGARQICGACAKLALIREEGCDPGWIEDADGTIIPFDPARRRKKETS